MELTAVAVAVGFAALSPQCVERAGEERSSSQALFQELRELMLDREQLGVERAELLVHGWGPGGICRSLLISSFHEKLYNRGSAHTTLLALGAPPRH